MPFSDIIRADLREHLERFASGDDEALVFTSPMGTPMRHSNFYRRVWLPAVAKVGRSGALCKTPSPQASELQRCLHDIEFWIKPPGIHFHDLRHTGNTLTLTDEGANLRELMDRMGHSSTRAALIYLHSSNERQRMLADAVGKTARTALRRADGAKKASGTEVARRRRDKA